MHLPVGESGRIDDGDVAIDLDQAPGDIVILSAADSELATIAAAIRRRGDGLSTRLANLGKLAHPLSVDLYVEKTLAPARLVLVRAMGGHGYWPYGLDQLRALARAGGPKLIVVPGEDRWDENLETFSTVSAEDARLAWRYLVEGGAANCDRLVSLLEHLLGRGERPLPPVVLPHAGCYWPGKGAVPNDELKRRLQADRPVAGLVFYRALISGDSAAPIDALVHELAARDIDAMPVFVTSLKDRESEAFLTDLFAACPPDIVLNTTSFAVSRAGGDHAGTVLDQPGRPVLQVVLAGSSEDAWRESTRGLGPRDLTMNVVLPEVDGRVLTRAISFKQDMPLDLEGRSSGTSYRPVADRVHFVAEQAARWIRLARTKAKDRRIAIVLSNYPDKDGRIANGVGLDTPASAARLGKALAEAGYDVAGFPPDSAALMARLAGWTDERTGRDRRRASVACGLSYCSSMRCRKRFVALLPSAGVIRRPIHPSMGRALDLRSIVLEMC